MRRGKSATVIWTRRRRRRRRRTRTRTKARTEQRRQRRKTETETKTQVEARIKATSHSHLREASISPDLQRSEILISFYFLFSENFLLGHLWQGHSSKAIFIETIPHRGTCWQAGWCTCKEFLIAATGISRGSRAKSPRGDVSRMWLWYSTPFQLD
jgi:hypothetical protein